MAVNGRKPTHRTRCYQTSPLSSWESESGSSYVKVWRDESVEGLDFLLSTSSHFCSTKRALRQNHCKVSRTTSATCARFCSVFTLACCLAGKLVSGILSVAWETTVLLSGQSGDVESGWRAANSFTLLFWEYNHLPITGEGMSREGWEHLPWVLFSS